jgi:hypothetical protein
MMNSPDGDLNTQSIPNCNIISLAEYRARRLGGADGDAPPPSPGALGARPFTWDARVEADARRHGATVRALTFGQLGGRRTCHAASA